MRRPVLILILAAVLGSALLIAGAPTRGQQTLPTPKGQLGGKVPLDPTPIDPPPLFPTTGLPTPPPRPPPATTLPAGTPPATPLATPVAE